MHQIKQKKYIYCSRNHFSLSLENIRYIGLITILFASVFVHGSTAQIDKCNFSSASLNSWSFFNALEALVSRHYFIECNRDYPLRWFPLYHGVRRKPIAKNIDNFTTQYRPTCYGKILQQLIKEYMGRNYGDVLVSVWRPLMAPEKLISTRKSLIVQVSWRKKLGGISNASIWLFNSKVSGIGPSEGFYFNCAFS